MTESPSSGPSASILARILENGSTLFVRIGRTSRVLNLRAAIPIILPNDSDATRPASPAALTTSAQPKETRRWRARSTNWQAEFCSLLRLGLVGERTAR